MKLELIAATTFGLEAPVKRELIALGYKILKSEDGKITFLGDERAIVRACLLYTSFIQGISCARRNTQSGYTC